MIDLNKFTDGEWRSFNDALDALRDALPTYTSIDTVPVRNPSGELYEVRAYEGKGGRLLADVAIGSDGALAPVRAR